MISSRLDLDSSNRIGLRERRVGLVFAPLIMTLVMYLMNTWVAVLDRHFIFLYFHGMGPGFDTTPFGAVTASRYWKSGLVAGGAVMVPYIAANVILGRVVKSYRVPKWWCLWVLCAIPLVIIIPVLVMTVNDPVLPLSNAAQVTTVTFIGVALAASLGQVAAQHPAEYFLLMIDGFALSCLLASLPCFDSYSRWMARGSIGVIYRHLTVISLGVALLVSMTTFCYFWRRSTVPSAVAWFTAGLCIAYLFLPLYHHLCWYSDEGSWTDPDYFFYIPDADNYFARSTLVRIGVWLTVALIALGVTRLRLWLRRLRRVSCSE